MTLSLPPNFCSAISNQWPFPLTTHSISICHCYFDISHYTDDLYKQSLIDLPISLQTAINKRKAEYLAARLCAKQALKKFNYQGYPLSQEDKSPLWPPSLCGSISHSHGLAAAIVAQHKNWQSLGLDIELLLTQKRSEKLLPSIINTQEKKLIGNDISLFTSLAFSIKESLFKALYPLTHQRFYFEHAEIIDWTKQGEVTLKLLIDLSDQWKKGQTIKGQFFIKDNYIWSFIGIANPL